MATLVLTALGAVVGGPIGAAVGSGIGQAIDRATLFRPAAREGPRLTELGVQTSSYGSAIPQMFGTMRVAGTVIWSTDLIESRMHSGGGKGRAASDGYAYSASFAVLLSARPIVAVRRIWAEGQLLRGALGDWKTITGFRLHPGGEDQPVDPLIASAEGALAPAHRGSAYAVFEGLPLADYGNRIPSLTFEVVADPAPVSAGAIAAALAGEVDGEVATPIDGFAAAGSDVAGVLASLQAITGAWWRPAGGRLVMRDAAQDRERAVRTIADDGVTAGRGRRRGRSVAAAESVARSVSVAHYDPARDYQIGVQQARRPGPGDRADRIELPATMTAARAKAVAEALLVGAAAARTTRIVYAGLEAIDIVPGDVVALAGEDGRWRVTEAALEAMAVTLTLTLVPLAAGTIGATAATSGRAIGAPDTAIGATRLAVFELPSLDDAALTTPRLLVAANGAGAGWRRAGVMYSADAGASWIAAGMTAAPAAMGMVETAPLAIGAALSDERSRVIVRLDRADMVLGDADPARIDAGANLALVGDELIQFAGAQPLGAGRWALTGLRRGRRGTEAAIGGQAAGDRFVLIEPEAIRAIDLPLAAIGQRIEVMASGAGDIDAPAIAVGDVTGRSVVPPAPVRLTAQRMADGALAIAWIRRSRTGWRWIDAVDAPLGEEAEAYEVRIEAGEAVLTMLTAGLEVTVASTDVPAGLVRISVRQRGTLGLSPAAAIEM